MHHTFVIAQGNETEKTIATSTDRGDITLKLLLYDISDDPNTPLNNIQAFITFKDCSTLSLDDPNFLPLPWGDFHYGLWRSQITLTDEFDPNIHRIIMKIYFPGQIDPLNAEYWAQEYDNDKKKVGWEIFDQDLFLPNVSERSIIIRLSDSRPSESVYGDITLGFGDRDPNQWVIDHVGGLLWPIPVKGRCFIDSTRSTTLF